MDCFVTDGTFSLALTYEILEVLLKAFLILQEAHGGIVIRLTLAQLWQERPAIHIRRGHCHQATPKDELVIARRRAYLAWKSFKSSMFLKMASLWPLTSLGASGESACLR